MPPLQGSTEVLSVRMNTFQLGVCNGELHLHARQVLHRTDHRNPATEAEAQRPRLKTKILLQNPVISQHVSASHALCFDLHADQWRDHSGLISSYSSNVQAWFIHVHFPQPLICVFVWARFPTNCKDAALHDKLNCSAASWRQPDELQVSPLWNLLALLLQSSAESVDNHLRSLHE